MALSARSYVRSQGWLVRRHSGAWFWHAAKRPGAMAAVIGLVPGRPLAVALGLGTLAGSYAFVAARWLAEGIASGRDPTPAPLRPERFTLV